MNILPTQDVKAMGRKLAGEVGSWSAAGFGISLITAIFQAYGRVSYQYKMSKQLDRYLLENLGISLMTVIFQVCGTVFSSQHAL